MHKYFVALYAFPPQTYHNSRAMVAEGSSHNIEASSPLPHQCNCGGCYYNSGPLTMDRCRWETLHPGLTRQKDASHGAQACEGKAAQGCQGHGLQHLTFLSTSLRVVVSDQFVWTFLPPLDIHVCHGEEVMSFPLVQMAFWPGTHQSTPIPSSWWTRDPSCKPP